MVHHTALNFLSLPRSHSCIQKCDLVHLVENPEGNSHPSHHGAFEVDDIEGAAEALNAKGVETTDITTRNDGQRVFFIHDIDDNRIEICTKSGFGILV